MTELLPHSMRESIGSKLLKFGMEMSQDAETMLHDPDAAYPGVSVMTKLGESALWLAGKVLPPHASSIESTVTQSKDSMSNIA